MNGYDCLWYSNDGCRLPVKVSGLEQIALRPFHLLVKKTHGHMVFSFSQQTSTKTFRDESPESLRVVATIPMTDPWCCYIW